MKWNSQLYQEKHSFVYDYGENLIKILNPQKNQRILDLGCGSGELTNKINQLAGEDGKVIGIDKSPEMIQKARSNFPGLEFLVSDASDFKFVKRFDSIFSNAVLHWVKDYKSAIACMYNNLKLEGKIVVEFGGKGNVENIISALKKSLLIRGYTQQSNIDRWYFPSIGEYVRELEQGGFKVLLAEYYDRPTELANEKSGIKDWLLMFAGEFFAGVNKGDIEEIKSEVQEKIKEKCLIDGKWFADYKRVRFVAIKD